MTGLVKDIPDDHVPTVPWTIVNRYYTAEVKFLIHTPSSWALIQDQHLAPALLFIWNRGEPYRDHIRELFQHASRHEFEVALAIRLPHTDSTLSAEGEDDQAIDTYLSSHGFEFVDVPDTEASPPDRSGIPGIPRIIDALSTIMWPSMVRRTSTRVTTGFFGAMQRNPRMLSDDYHNLLQLVGEKISGNDGDRMLRELKELEHWLDEGTSSTDAHARSTAGKEEAVPWSTVVTPGTLSPSSSGFLENSCPATPKACFDDDFTSFVSASSPSSTSILQPPLQSLASPGTFLPLASTSFSSTFSFNSALSGCSTDDHAGFDATYLASDESYRSLGSVSDLEDLDRDSIDFERLFNSNDQAEEDVPSQAEIAETSHKIFGTAPLSLSPAQKRGDGSIRALTALGGAPSRGNPDQEVDLEHLDLESVLSALQGLKEEIAGMPDKERREAAARVALGLVYGLDSNAHPERREEPV